MASTQKTAANVLKTSSTSAGTRPQAIAATKENNQTDLSMATKRTTNSSTRPPALKPIKSLQTHASSNGVKDAEMAVMLASLRG